MEAQVPLTRQIGFQEDEIETSIPVSWADMAEQYDALFGHLVNDTEAQLMGVPPPPDDWEIPKHTYRAPQLPALSRTWAFQMPTENKFSALAQEPLAPSTSLPSSCPTSALLSATSIDLSEEPQTPRRSAHTSSEWPASAP